MNSIKIISALFAVIIITALPVMADINQKADLNGRNVVVVKVEQVAWNYGSGDINQDAVVHVTGNTQMIEQDSSVIISDSDYSGNITMNGINLIKVDLGQYSKNYASGSVSQGIDVVVEGNTQILDQGVIIV